MSTHKEMDRFKDKNPPLNIIIHLRWYNDYTHYSSMILLSPQVIRSLMAKLAHLRVVAHGQRSQNGPLDA